MICLENKRQNADLFSQTIKSKLFQGKSSEGLILLIYLKNKLLKLSFFEVNHQNA